MKINIKDKKVVASIVGVVSAIAIVAGTMLYSPINEASNNAVSISSAIMNIKDNIKEDNTLLLEAVASMKKISSDEAQDIQIDSVLKEVGNIKDTGEIKTNDNIKVLDKFNKELDKMKDVYENNAEMKNDATIANNMEQIGYLNILIDGIMSDFNLVYVPSFNEIINKFPVNIVAKTKGWSSVDKFTSIK